MHPPVAHPPTNPPITAHAPNPLRKKGDYSIFIFQIKSCSQLYIIGRKKEYIARRALNSGYSTRQGCVQFMKGEDNVVRLQCFDTLPTPDLVLSYLFVALRRTLYDYGDQLKWFPGLRVTRGLAQPSGAASLLPPYIPLSKVQGVSLSAATFSFSFVRQESSQLHLAAARRTSKGQVLLVCCGELPVLKQNDDDSN